MFDNREFDRPIIVLKLNAPTKVFYSIGLNSNWKDLIRTHPIHALLVLFVSPKRHSRLVVSAQFRKVC